VDDANNRLIADNQSGGVGSDSVLAFSRTANGNTAPLLAVSGPATGLSGPFGLALDAVGGLTGVGGLGPAIPALTWEGLLALALMMALVGAVALQRTQ
jgi:hypothetical protein